VEVLPLTNKERKMKKTLSEKEIAKAVAKKTEGYNNYKKVFGIKDTSKYVCPQKRSDGIDRREFTSNEIVVEPANPTSIKRLVESGLPVPEISRAFAVHNSMTIKEALNTEDPLAKNGIDILVALSNSAKTINLVNEFMASKEGKAFQAKLDKAKEQAEKAKKTEQEEQELKDLKQKLKKLEENTAKKAE
jgi:hypothetical protein